MCRNIRTLFNFDPPATEEEIRAASVQFVRKLAGFTRPSRANEAAFDLAVEDVAVTARRLVDSLVTTAPAPVTVPEREPAPGFAAALIVTVPLPLPLAPLWTVSHDALPAAVHVHPLPAVTLTVVVPPALGRLRVVGDTVKTQAPA